MNLSLLKQYAISLIGIKYFFGGDDAVSGFDCSGLVSELMRAAGLVPYNYRENAQGIHDFLKATGAHTLGPVTGSIAFYGKSSTEIHHIGFCLDSNTMVEAGGGDSTTKNDQVAIQQNAFVRMRPIKFRKDFLFALWPNYPTQIDVGG